MNKLAQPFNGKTLLRFELFQETLVPRSENFTPVEREASRELVNNLLSSQPPIILIKIKLFMVMIEVFALITQRNAFGQLTNENRNQVLDAFFGSPISLLRKGFWGLNTLARLGVYGQTTLHEELGYHLRSQSSVEIEK